MYYTIQYSTLNNATYTDIVHMPYLFTLEIAQQKYYTGDLLMRTTTDKIRTFSTPMCNFMTFQ